MKKSNLLTGLIYLIVGVISLVTALVTNSKLDGLLFGFAGAGIFPGFLLIYRYYYWNKPGNRERYEEKLEDENIQQQDELNVKLRDKSGRYAYILGICTVSFSIVLFSILGVLEIIENTRLIILYLGGYLIFQIGIGILIFNHLLKKY